MQEIAFNDVKIGDLVTIERPNNRGLAINQKIIDLSKPYIYTRGGVFRYEKIYKQDRYLDKIEALLIHPDYYLPGNNIQHGTNGKYRYYLQRRET